VSARLVSAGLVASALLLAACGDSAPDPAEVFKVDYRIGFEAVQAHDFAKAAQYLGEAAQIDPNDPYVQLNLGVAYQNLGEMDKARAAYEQAVKTGQGVRPTRVTDPRYSGRTVAELARDDLASLPPR
jgi:Tfp pilus assembly protein PilF